MGCMLLVGFLLALTVSAVFAVSSSTTNSSNNYNSSYCSPFNKKYCMCNTKDNFVVKRNQEYFLKRSNCRKMKMSRKVKPKPIKGGGGGGGGAGNVGLISAAAAGPALAAAAGGLGSALTASLLRIPAIMVSIAAHMGNALMSGHAIVMAQIALIISVIVVIQLALNSSNKHEHREDVIKHLFLDQKDVRKFQLKFRRSKK